MSREKIESLIHAMIQANLEWSISDADREGDLIEAIIVRGEDHRPH
jgi:hypothetical protein